MSKSLIYEWIHKLKSAFSDTPMCQKINVNYIICLSDVSDKTKVTESILIGLTAAWNGEQRSQFATCQLASVVKASLCFSSFCLGSIQALMMNEMYIISYVSLMLFSKCFHWWFAHQYARSAPWSASRCRPWWSLFQSRDTVYLLTW